MNQENQDKKDKLDYISDLSNGNKKVMLVSGETIEIRKPKVKDLRVVKHIKDDEDRELTLISNLSMKTEAEIDDMDLIDYKRLQAGLASFLS